MSQTVRSPIVDELAAILPSIAAAAEAEILRERQAAYEIAHRAAEAALEAVASLPGGAAVTDDLAAIRARHLVAADDLAGGIPPDFGGALQLLGGVQAACNTAAAVAGLQAKHDAAVLVARSEIAALKGFVAADGEAIERELIGEAERAAAARHYDAAAALLGDVTDRCRAAQLIGAERAALTDMIDEVGRTAAALAGPFVAPERKAAEKDLAEATKAADERSFVAARGLVGAARASCADAEALLLRQAAFELALAKAKELVGGIAAPVAEPERTAIETDLIAAAEREAALRHHDRADELLAQVGAKVEAAQTIIAAEVTFNAALLALETRLGTITAAVVGPEVTAIRDGFVTPAKAAAAMPGRAFAGATATLGRAGKSCDVAELHARRYAAVEPAITEAYTQFNTTALSWVPASGWLGWGTAPIPGVTDVLADIKVSSLDGATAKAALGDYAGAMAGLEATRTRVAAASAALTPFVAWYKRTRTAVAGLMACFNANNVADMRNALRALNALTFTQAVAAAKTADFTAANARMDIWDKDFPPLRDAIDALRNANTDIQALRGGSVDDLADLLETTDYDGGLAALGADVPGARALADKGRADCPLVTAYGAALDAAENDLATGADMYDDDRQQIRDDLIDKADQLARGAAFAAGTAMLLRVPTEAASARALYGAVDAAVQDAESVETDVTGDSLDTARVTVETLLQSLRDHAEAPFVAGAIADIEAKLLDAGTLVATDRVAAGEALKAAAGAAAAAMNRAENVVRLRASITHVEGRLASIDAAADPEKQLIQTDCLDVASSVTDASDISANLAALAAAEAACTMAEQQAVLSQAYDAALLTAQTDIGTLTDPFLIPDKLQVEADTTTPAAGKAATRDFEGALDALKPVAAACTTARAILAEKVKYDPLRIKVHNGWNNSRGLLRGAVTAGLPDRPDITAERLDIKTNFLDAAAGAVTGRGTGAPALAAMQRAVKLLQDIAVRADQVWTEATAYKRLATRRSEADSAVSTLKGLPGHGEVAVELTGIDRLMTSAATLAAANQSAAAQTLYSKVVSECAKCTVFANAAAGTAAALTSARDRIALCDGKLKALTDPPEALKQVFATLQTETVETAAKLAGGRDFAAAGALLATVEPRCIAIETQITGAGQFAAALPPAEEAVARLGDPTALPEAARIAQLLVAPAKAAALRLDFKTALDLLGKVAGGCDGAKAIADAGTAAGVAREQAGTDLGGPLPGAIAAVKKLLAPLLDHVQAAAITDLTDPIAAAIEAAGQEPPPPDATARLVQAADRCGPARVAEERHAAFASALAAAEHAASGLSGDLVAGDRLGIEAGPITQAKALAAAPGRAFAEATEQLDAAMAAAATAAALLARDGVFQPMLLAAQSALTAVGAPAAGDGGAGDEAAALQATVIDAAKTLAALPKRDFDAAETLLAGVAGQCKNLALRIKMAGGTAPGEDELRALMAEPGGTKLLDEMVLALPDTVKREVMQTAIKLRFDLESFGNFDAAGGAKDAALGKSKSLKKIYGLLASVPEAHTRDNPSLDKIERYGGKSSLPENVKRGSFFREREQKVVLSCGRATDDNPQPLAKSVVALPDVEPDCELVADSEVPPPKYFDWTTLHEVGHAIDDKKRFMRGKAGVAAFGGWQAHGADVVPVAKAVAKACTFEGDAGESYLIAYLLGAKPSAPPAPPTRGDWEDSRKKAVAWCDEIRVGKELWANGGAAAAHAVEGRVYHEAYAGNWVSYELGARSQGVTGYQFRAPGEWLSELYAAYYCKKLKPTHPAVSWLQTL